MKYDVQEQIKPRGLTGISDGQIDYGAGEKGKYVKAFLENVSWEIVEHRFKDSVNRIAPARG